MARIPDAELEKLKHEVSLQRLVEAKGVQLERHGADLLGRCPFHDDTTPSLVVSPKKNLWHCLGACQKGGSVVDWVMRAEGVSFRHAVELLRAESPSLAASKIVRHSTVPKLSPVLERSTDDQAALRQVIDYYHSTLKQSPEALGYLEKRGLRSAEMVDRFKLGFSNRTLGYRLPAKNREAGAELRGRLTKLGILRDTGHEHFRGSLVIPVLDEHGQVLEVYGRKITEGLRKGTPDHLYLPGGHRGVWNLEALASSDEIILCEALIDALTFWCAGMPNVTSSYGINGFTEEHLAAFKKHGTKRVLIAYDGDDAGNSAAAELAKKLLAEGLDCYRVRFPKGTDANAYALAVQPADKSLRLAITNAEWLGKGARVAPNSSSSAVAAKQDSPSALVTISPAPASPLAAEAPVLPARREPEAPPPAVPAEVQGDEVTLTFGARRWRVRGLGKNMSYELLRVNVLCARGDTDAFHVDTLDLYSARQRAAFLREATRELDVEERVLKTELGKVLHKLEELQHAQIKAALEPKETAPAMNDAAREAALELLRAPNLLDRVLSDFEACGVVGEETNKVVGYLAAVSRKLDAPLAVIIQSSSAAGKSSLMDAVLAFVPEEDRIKYSAMTGQSLFYMGEANLKHKILAVVEEAGAERAAYALKLLQSEGELTIASTGKDPTTGRLVTHEYRVEGPVMIFLTTTAIEIDDELLNRCLVLTVDEDRGQTRAIHRMQRESQTLEGLLTRARKSQVLALHQDAQRLLRPLLVANPFARRLTFLDAKTRTRRDHMKYLTLIRAIALLHQYQREVKTATVGAETVEYIEVTASDIAIANRLAHEALGRSLDELPPQSRRLLELLDGMVRAGCERDGIERRDYRFSRRDVREVTGWGQTQLRIHLERLVELEYVLPHRGGRGQSFVYELCFDGAAPGGRPQLAGLAELEADAGTTQKLAGVEAQLAAPLRGQNGGMAGGSRPREFGRVSEDDSGNSAQAQAAPRTTQIRALAEERSYVGIAARRA